MRPRRLSIIAVTTLAACTAQQARRADTAAPAAATLAGAPAGDVTAAKQAIEAQNARFADALVKGDTATIASTYADDAIVMMSEVPAAHGHDAIAKTFAGMGSAMKVTAFKLTSQDVIVSGDYAIETGAYDMNAQPMAKGAKPEHGVGKYLVVWKKQADGSYKILRDIANSDQPMK
jgi:ketosteroid isomerase-like protein